MGGIQQTLSGRRRAVEQIKELNREWTLINTNRKILPVLSA
jgi:hypothetical protein